MLCDIYGEQENWKNCCAIYMGSPPQTTIINTRHTPPTNNYHYNNHQQPLLPLQPQPPITPSKQVNHAEPPSSPRAPASLLSPVRLGASFGLHWGNVSSSPAHQQATATTGSCGTLAETRNTSASRPPSKQAPRHTMPANTDSAPLTVMR